MYTSTPLYHTLYIYKYANGSSTAFKYAVERGLLVRYVDGRNRRCYLVIAGFIADYKEQVLITRVKSRVYYILYYVPPSKREILSS